MLRVALATATVALLASSPAQASFAVFCDGSDGASVRIPLGGGVGTTPMSVTIEFGGQTWTSETSLENPQAIVTSQAFVEGSAWYFDFADANIERVVAKVRLFSSVEPGDAIGGILELPGVGSATLSCSYG
jgi:hypothetical protein